MSPVCEDIVGMYRYHKTEATCHRTGDRSRTDAKMHSPTSDAKMQYLTSDAKLY